MNTDDMLLNQIQLAVLPVIKPAGEQTARQAATAASKALRKLADECGFSGAVEVGLHKPGHFGSHSGWDASFEAGPYHWGIVVSMAISASGVRLCETHYGFDLMFYDAA